MSRSQLPPESVLELAKKQLDYSSSNLHPQLLHVYAGELSKHLRLYPHDTNFRVKVEASLPFGAVTCLEDSCQGVEIALAPRFGAPNDGRDVGLGSLSAYRKHITDHPSHVESRNARLRKGRIPKNDGPSGTTPRRSNILRALDEEFSSAPATPARTTSKLAARQLLARSSSVSHTIKPEPVDVVIPRKRVSDVAFGIQLKPEPSEFGAFSAPDMKKVKAEVAKTPLALANRAAAPTAVERQLMSNAVKDDAEDMRTKLSEVQSQIGSVEAKLYKAEDKYNKTKADFTRINRLRRELADLKAIKDKYNAALPSAKPLSRAGSGPSGLHGSPVKSEPRATSSNVLLPVPPPFHNPAYNGGQAAFQPVVHHNPTVNVFSRPPQPQLQPRVASGSNVKLEAPPVKMEINPAPIDANLDFQRLTAGVPGFKSYDPNDRRFDADGDFFGRGKDTFAGPVAKADDIDKFLIAAGNAEQFDGNVSVDKALERLGLQGLYQTLPGMEVALMPHQVIGVAWMLDKEKSSIKGGCLADEMGLGKTVQMIATIVANRSTNPLVKTTLIVSPLALLDQWQQEIELKTNINLKCLIYHGNNKVKRAEELQKYDIVLTTFQTLAFEWPDEEAQDRELKRKQKKKKSDWIVDDDDAQDDKTKVKKGRKTLGPLFEVEWYRVCLDEAQNVRNRRTRASRAVTQLTSTYRWTLTGTPIINGLGDAYGFLRFLRFRPWYDWQAFNSHITLPEKKQPDVATMRLQTIFKTIMLRRKKDTMLDGQKLIELPDKDVTLTKLEFAQEEREIYQMVETRSQEVFNRYLRAGTVLKNYAQVLVMLLRLRQICAHPALITEGGAAYVGGDQEDAHGHYAELTRAQRLMGLDFVLRMREKFKQVALERMAAEKASADATLEGEDYECPICFDSYTEATITPCGHLFCRECIMNVLNGAQREDANEQAQYRADERPCPACRGAVSKDKLFLRAAFEPTEAELTGNGDVVASKGDGDVEMVDVEVKPKPGRALRKRKPTKRIVDSDEEDEAADNDDDLSDFIAEDDEDEDEADARRAARRRLRTKGKARKVVVSDDEMDDDIICGAKPDFIPVNPEQIKIMPRFLPSTKMKYMMETLKKWAAEHPDEKVLIISQWTSCLQLVSDYLTENGFLHVKYQGDMIRTKRDLAVRVFMAKDKATIMLMSMKCGGVGLNLTRANRVISLDLGWSEAVESQAFDRVHRLGQTRNVFVERLVISDSVEDRVLALQQRKKLLADLSLGEGNAQKVGRLSVKELANLFGLDHRGRVLTQAQD